ncbi:unnamed protein product [Somion occarium]|uniref:Alanine dehydrogenase/pyridine nucleotide transhydrogenase N-terminal domain-containing protein n=1 Tax=Somion occarium TaxID=3059160 RepID=A0ABP1D3D7_9APHY
MTVLRRTRLTLHRVARRAYHASRPKKLTIGIRREDPQRIWERRCPVSPEAVAKLVQTEDVDVLVQDCERRVWSSKEFVEAGARVHPTLSPTHITIGIKEPPVHEMLVDPVPSPYNGPPELLPRTHLMFSHTTKGQLYNMELLSKFLVSKDATNLPARLIDYELLTGEDGKRTVGFGWFAGVAGALESLSALAHALLELGVASPFLYTPRPHNLPNLESIISTLRERVGLAISSNQTPKGVGPIVIGVTGTGKVSEGVLDLLKHLPICKVGVEELPTLVSDPNTRLDQIYLVHALPQDYFIRRGGEPYDRSHYYANPSDYKSEFHLKVAPYLTLLMNGAGWAPSFPRLMTNEQLANALERARQVGRGRFICVGDISCDVEGGLEYMPRPSTLSLPSYKTRPPSLPAHLPSITMMSVDILPTALPLEASKHFSSVLYPYLRTLIRQYRAGAGQLTIPVDAEEEARLSSLGRATVAQNGVLTEPHKWLEGPLSTWRQSIAKTSSDSAHVSAANSGTLVTERKKKVLVLGSGMVAGPAIDEICSWKDTELVVASNILHEAQRLTSSHSNAKSVALDVNDLDKVGALVSEADVVISLLPVPFHPRIAELCIKHGKHMVTASYISPAMKSLHERATDSSVLLLNEIGLDPGIDHCSAFSLFNGLREAKKRVVSFTSFCGGLPAPENAEGVPLKYKFSWSPKGVLSAALNSARFKLWDQVQEIPGRDLLKERFPNLPISDVLKLEGIANRDSLPYRETYDLGPLDGIRTLFRGTLRYEGFSRLMHLFKSIGLLDTELKSALNDLLPGEDTQYLLDACSSLGILPPALRPLVTEQVGESDLPAVPSQPSTPIELFAALLAHRLRYLPGERDLVVLSHEVVAQEPSTGEESIHTSSLVAYGTPQASAMARTVGLPVALAARIVLDGKVSARGVWGPGVDRAVWKGVLTGLEQRGIGFKESVSRQRRVGGIVETSLRDARRISA